MTLKPAVLIVEDETALTTLLHYNLEREGYRVLEARDGEEALLVAAEERPDVVLLDWMLPQLSGIEVCRRLRSRQETRNIPIIMLTARGEESERIRGLATGADDYIVKPFSANELLARVRSVLRRSKKTEGAARQAVFNHNNLQIDLARAEVFLNGKMVYLSATEYRILLQMAQNVGQVLGSEQLLRDVWGDEYVADKEILWVSISRLRQKLEDDPRNPKHIQTRSGMGYIMPIEG